MTFLILIERWGTGLEAMKTTTKSTLECLKRRY